MASDGNNGSKSTIFMLPCIYGIHLGPMLDLAELLLRPPHSAGRPLSSSVTILIIPSEKAASAVASASAKIAASGLDISFLTLPPAEPVAAFKSHEDLFSVSLERYVPAVKAAIASSDVRVAAIVLDMFATSINAVARELNVPFYYYFTSPAWVFALVLRVGELNEEVNVPGLPPIPSAWLPDCFVDRSSKAYAWMAHHGRLYTEAKGVILNQPAELTSEVMAAISEGRCVPGKPLPVYAVGPVLGLTKGDQDQAPKKKHECVEWLDRQPARSVVFLCFGSMGSFDAVQVQDMAAGLEHSGHRFLWALRVKGADDPLSALPEGFVERTKGRGLVWPSWAPQIDILSHDAIGVFLSHSGWNSTLESLWFGVPMICWPLYAEQHLSAFLLSAELGVAVRLNVDRKKEGYVGAGELEQAVRHVLDNPVNAERMRANAGELKEKLRKAMRDGGSSTATLRRLAEDLDGGK